VRPDQVQVLNELAAALRGEVEARIEGERDRLHEVSQIVIETLLALARGAPVEGTVR
jgi:hypothetical protein